MRRTEKRPKSNAVVASVIVYLIIMGIYTFVCQYIFLVPISLHSIGFWIACVVGCAVTSAYIFLVQQFVLEYDSPNEKTYTLYGRASKITRIAAIIAFILMVLLCVLGSTLFHAKKYSSFISISDGDEEKDIPDIESDVLVVVDWKTAERLGDRQLAFVPNSTYYEVADDYNLIQIGDSYYRVAPINYGGFFKHNKAKNIPAFIQVEATSAGNAQSAKAIMFEEPMLYSPSAYWGYDLERHLHFNYPTYILGTSSFEVDDDLIPYWITPISTPTIFLFSGVLQNKVIVTNAITGECNEYATNELPSWVDHAHTVGYMFSLVTCHYKYQQGFWNAHFGKTGVFNTSYDYRSQRTSKDESEHTPFEGYNYVIGKDGKIYAYTGITPENAAETNTGFVLVDPRTVEAKFYEAAGAEESSAQLAAEGLVQNLRYSASFPTIIDIGGEFAYFMSLKDNAGLVQRYAICYVKNYSKVVEATTIEEAIRKYTGSSADSTIESSDEVTEDQAKETIHMKGIVTEVETAEKDGNTYYFFTLQDDEYVYVSPITISSLQPFKLKANQSVTFECYDSNESGIRTVTEINFK